MAAGFKYNLEPEVEQEERYDVETGRRRRGPYKLDTTNLVVGSYLPSFTPIAADLVKKTSQVAIRVEVYEKFTTGSNTTLKSRNVLWLTKVCTWVTVRMERQSTLLTRLTKLLIS